MKWIEHEMTLELDLGYEVKMEGEVLPPVKGSYTEPPEDACADNFSITLLLPDGGKINLIPFLTSKKYYQYREDFIEDALETAKDNAEAAYESAMEAKRESREDR